MIDSPPCHYDFFNGLALMSSIRPERAPATKAAGDCALTTEHHVPVDVIRPEPETARA
jgi:hypothetical protein